MRTLRLAAVPAIIVFSITSLPLLAIGGGAESQPPQVLVAGIEPRVLDAYLAADGWCEGLRWELLAGIGWVESQHATAEGASTDPDTGKVSPPILGPELDGTHGPALPAAEWAGYWGITGPWEQAVGPMQFRAPTFAAWAVDADADGVTDPHDIDDAVTSAANYLCRGQAGSVDDETRALLRYNNSTSYVDEVLAYADTLSSGLAITGGTWLCPVAGPTSFADTWLAPRSGGRLHHGVDMFAATGTPAVTPVAGLLEHATNDLGGLAFRLWGDDGNFYYGAHLSAFGSITGRVPAGTIAGYVGSTGNAVGTGAHLHFEIHPGRQRGDASSPVNPTPTVTEHCEANRLGGSFTGSS